jgi:hypothetical protein
MEVNIIIIISITIQPYCQFGQEPEPSQATGMALLRCILGNFLGLLRHCFPPEGNISIEKLLTMKPFYWLALINKWTNSVNRNQHAFCNGYSKTSQEALFCCNRNED